jgi:hypothetical protein
MGILWEALEGLLLVLSPFTALGIWDRRKLIKTKLNEWTAPKKEKPKQEPGAP